MASLRGNEKHKNNEYLVINYPQTLYKLPKHREIFNLKKDFETKGKDKKFVIPQTESNAIKMQKEIEKIIRNNEFKVGRYRKGKPNECKVLHFFEPSSKIWVVFEKEEGNPRFNLISSWKLSPKQVEDLKQNNNVS